MTHQSQNERDVALEPAKLNLGWFSSGRGEGSLGLLQAALKAIDTGQLSACIDFVFCNRERGQNDVTDHFLDVVESHEIPVLTLSSQRFRREHGGRPWSELRECFDNAAMQLVSTFSPDVTVTAGYMLISPLICQHYRMINLHPALPGGPTGIWQDVIWNQIDRRSKESGVMMNTVTEDVDGGPVLSYCEYPITGVGFDSHWREIGQLDSEQLKRINGQSLMLFQAIREAGLKREKPFLVATLQAISEKRIDITSAGAASPLDLTIEVESVVFEPT